MNRAKRHSASTSWTLCLCLVSLLASAHLSWAAIVRQPYLQAVTPNSLTIVWRTDNPGGPSNNSRVQYGTSSGSLNQTAIGVSAVPPSNSAVKDHFVTITGLSPGTRYFYNVGTTSGVEGGGTTQHFFITAPSVGSEEPFRVWALGDSGDGSTRQRAVRDSMLAATSANPPDLILHLGDIAYESGTDSDFTNKHFAIYQNILRNTPLWPSFGNHEAVSSSATLGTGPYFEGHVLPANGEAGGQPSGTEAYYSFDYGNAHFIVLDSHDNAVQQNSSMLDWLQADLAATTQKWVIAYFHHPPYSKGSHDSDSASDSDGRLVYMRETVVPILEAGGVDLVLSGHSHNYERSYLINGAYGYPNFVTPSFSTLSADGHILDDRDGDPQGDGPYEKDPAGNAGAVYVVAGHGGKLVEGTGGHPVMFFTDVTNLGSLLLDIDGDVLTLRDLRSNGVVADVVAIDKSGVTGPPVNQAPNGVIDTPASNVNITVGQSVNFTGTGTDPDNNTPLTFLWTFGTGSGIANSTAQDPGSVTFNNAGTFTVTFTVRDALGLADPTPATRTVTVSGAGGGNMIMIEAETGAVTAPMAIAFDSQASGGQYVEVPQGIGNNSNDATNGGPGQVNFPINIPQAGTYALWARVLAPNTHSDSFYVTRNGTLIREWTIAVSTTWQWRKVADVTLSSGLFNLAFRQRDDGTKLDRVILSDDPSFVPDDDPTPPTNQAPNGVIDTPASNVNITVGQSVNFTGTGSDPDNNTPLTFLWNFGTGSGIANSTAQDPGSVTFNNAGTFTITFTVTDALGLADPTPATRTVTVTGAPTNQAPNGVIDTPASNVNITVGQSVNFTGTGSDPDNNTPLTFLWNFGTGSGIANSTAQDPGSVTFNNAGTFTITFTVTDALGLADPTPATRTVTVTGAPTNQAPNGVIDTPASNVNITVGQSVNFTGTGSDPDNNTPLTFLWNFGTGSGIANSTAQDPGSVTFNNAGTFTITFTVTDALGLADPTPATRTVTVTGSGGGNLITVEAESGTLTAPMAIAFDSQASGGQYVEVPEGMGNNQNDATNGGPGQINFPINIPQPGTYALWARVLAPNTHSDSFYVTRDGTLIREWTIAVSTTWQWRKVADVTLSSGLFNLAFRQRDDGTKLDEIILTDDLSFVPGP